MEDKTTHTVLKKVDNSVFESFESFIHESLRHFNSLNILADDIIVYMPNYFNKMLSEFWSNKYPISSSCIKEFRGMKIVAGYENKIIVAVKEGMLYNIEHREMPIN